MTGQLIERTYGVDFADDKGDAYVQRDAASMAQAIATVRRDYPSTSVVYGAEVVYTAPENR